MDASAQVFGPKPPAVGKRGGVNPVLASSAAGLKDFILHATLSKRPMAGGCRNPDKRTVWLILVRYLMR
jgi:hypothetical protein